MTRLFQTLSDLKLLKNDSYDFLNLIKILFILILK
jgi:hypothetical protein